MIRSLLVFSALVFSLSAYASPKVGDYAAYATTLSLNGQTIQADVQRELTQFNASTNQYLERQTTQISGQSPQVNESWTDASNYLDDATIDSVLANCAASGGALQAVSVPAGSFNTCALPFSSDDSSGTAFVAKVPFGVVRLDSVRKSDGMTTQMNLRAFH
jgi:hypothetical protein